MIRPSGLAALSLERSLVHALESSALLLIESISPRARCAPLPLAGRGWGWGSQHAAGCFVPAPQRGRERAAAAATAMHHPGKASPSVAVATRPHRYPCG